MQLAIQRKQTILTSFKMCFDLLMLILQILEWETRNNANVSMHGLISIQWVNWD